MCRVIDYRTFEIVPATDFANENATALPLPPVAFRIQISDSVTLPMHPALVVVKAGNALPYTMRADRANLLLNYLGDMDATGNYSTGYMVNGLPCRARSSFSVGCRPEYESVGQRCRRRPDMTVCATSTVDHFAPKLHERYSEFDSSLHFIANKSALAISLWFPSDTYFTGCRMSLVPVRNVMSMMLAHGAFTFARTGRYLLRGVCPARQADPCVYPSLMNIVIKCSPDEVPVGNGCSPKHSGCPGSQELQNGRCLQLPFLLASTRDVSIVVETRKSARGSTGQARISVKLQDGKFGLTWRAACSEVPWLSCEPAAGHLQTPSLPEDRVVIKVNSSGYGDYSVEKDKFSKLRFSSRVEGFEHFNSSFVGDFEEILVRMRVVADVLLEKSLVTIVTPEGDDDFGVGNDVFVHVAVRDVDGLPINRSQTLYAGIVDGDTIPYSDEKFARGKLTVGPLAYDEVSQKHSIKLPRSRFQYAQSYTIYVSLTPDSVIESSGHFHRTIEVKESKLVQFIVVGMIVLGLCALVGFLVRMIYQDPARAKSFLISFLSFELMLFVDIALEVWDIVSDSLCMNTVVHGDQASDVLKFCYSLFYGCAVIASAIAILVKLRLLIRKIRNRRAELKAHSGLEKELALVAERKDAQSMEEQEALSYILLAFAEDIPMGLLSAFFLREVVLVPISGQQQPPPRWAIILMLTSYATSMLFVGYKVSFLEKLDAIWYHGRVLELQQHAVIKSLAHQLQAVTLAKAFVSWHRLVAHGTHRRSLVAQSASDIRKRRRSSLTVTPCVDVRQKRAPSLTITPWIESLANEYVGRQAHSGINYQGSPSSMTVSAEAQKAVRGWSEERVLEWLRDTVNLPQVEALFSLHHIDGEGLYDMSGIQLVGMGVSTCTERTIILAHLFKLFANDGQQNGELHRSHARRFSELEPSSDDKPSADEMHLRRLMSSVAEDPSESESMPDSPIHEIADSVVPPPPSSHTTGAYMQAAGAAQARYPDRDGTLADGRAPPSDTDAADTTTKPNNGAVLLAHTGGMVGQQSTRLRLEYDSVTNTAHLVADRVAESADEISLQPQDLRASLAGLGADWQFRDVNVDDGKLAWI